MPIGIGIYISYKQRDCQSVDYFITLTIEVVVFGVVGELEDVAGVQLRVGVCCCSLCGEQHFEGCCGEFVSAEGYCYASTEEG